MLSTSHAREKEQEREWLFKGPMGNAAYGVVNSIIQGYPDSEGNRISLSSEFHHCHSVGQSGLFR